MTPPEQPKNPPARRRHWLLLAVPFVWCIAAIPLVNRVEVVFGNVPFVLVWMVIGVFVGSGAIYAVYAIDRRNDELDRI